MISLKRSKEIFSEHESLSKKRKWDDPRPTDEISEKPEKVKSMRTVFDTGLQSETPFPLEWQRCLGIKSGQLYFYNTRTHNKALGDQRTSPGPQSNPAPMSLELELNLPCQSLKENQVGKNYRMHDSGTTSSYSNTSTCLTRSPSWLTFEGDQQKIVNAVCKKCYMLVMMCKSSPACPNCKFVQPPGAKS